MKFTVGIVGGIVGLAALGLWGCQARLTLEEAQALCAERGGLLTVIYTQSVTASGVGEPVPSPGECISPSNFENTAPTAKDSGGA